MRKLTKLQYQVIFLYSKGLRFNEIDMILKTNSKGFYSQVLAKDKGRITRAKLSKQKNKRIYNQELEMYLDEVKSHNKYFKNSVQWVKDKYIITPLKAKEQFRIKYLYKCLNQSVSSYNRYKITFVRKYLEKVA